MRRILPFALVLLAGCGTTTEPTTPPTVPESEPDFATWPAVTETPIAVDPQIAIACDAAGASREQKQKTHGPHLHPYIVVRVNPEAVEKFKARQPLPVGTTVVKEKHADRRAATAPTEYTAMVKREAGYDPPHGDWEYLHVVRGPQRTITRGRLESCISCHVGKKGSDHLFRDYLPPAPGPKARE